MEAKTITITVPEIPTAWKRPGQSMKWGRVWRYDTQKADRLLWGIHIRNQYEGPFLVGPLHLDVLFAMPISQRIKPKQRELVHGSWHIKKPDSSNLLKLIEDIAQGLLFKDDCIIAKITVEKKYDKEPRTQFTLTEMR